MAKMNSKKVVKQVNLNDLKELHKDQKFNKSDDDVSHASKISMLTTDLQGRQQVIFEGVRNQGLQDNKNPLFRTSDDNFSSKPKCKNMLPTSPKITKKNRNLTRLPFEHELKSSMNLKSSLNFGEERDNKHPFGDKQMSVRMSKSFNNSSFTMHGPG